MNNIQNNLEQFNFGMPTVDQPLITPSVQLQYPADFESSKAIETAFDSFSLSKIIDLFWTKVFYYVTFFESLDGYSSSGTGTGTIDSSRLLLTTGAVIGNTWQISKSPAYQAILNWHKNQRMRTNIQVDSVANITASVVVGLVGADVHYGFRVSNATLQGTCGDSAQSTIDLKTIVANINYTVEARLVPGDKVVFYVDGVESGTLRRNLPVGGTSGNNQQLFEAKITTNAAAAKSLSLSFFEFIQEK